jgi:hypothetical protein
MQQISSLDKSSTLLYKSRWAVSNANPINVSLLNKIKETVHRVLWLLLIVQSAIATTLTGSLKNPDGTGATGYLFLSLSQQGALQSTGGCGGPAEIVPTYRVRVTVTAGSLIGSPSVYGNDCLLPNNLFYVISFQDINGNTLFSDRWVITGSSIDIGTIVSAVISGTTGTLGSTGLVLQVPTGNQTVNQPPSSNLLVNLFDVTDTLTLPNGGQCTASGCTGIIINAVTTNTTQSISGSKTFSVPILFNNTDLGSQASPANFGFFQSGVLTTIVRVEAGSVPTPTDYFDLNAPGLHQFTITNSSAQPVLSYIDHGNAVTSIWTMYGLLAPTQGLENHTISGADYVCSGIPDGVQVVRTDTMPPQLQSCVGGALYILNLQ